MTGPDRVAVVAAAARLPGVGADLPAFWDAARAARDLSSDVPPGRWVLPPAACVRPGGPHPDSVAGSRGYFLDPFHPSLAGQNLTADFVAELDPVFHLFLDVGGRAWHSAKTARVDLRRVGVVLGNICLPTEKASALARETLGKAARVTAGRNRYAAGLPAGLLARALGLGGGSFTLDAACATGLYAIKLAADDLLSGKLDAALVGGGSRPDALYTQMGFSQLRALSPSGTCSPFDAAADGLVVGEGAVIFVLKRLSDAVAHGDAVLGILAGAGTSNDIGGGLLAPAKEGQLRAMRAAYADAGWDPTDVDFIACHATGTPVGDAVEFDSLSDLWAGRSWRPGQCAVGSIKSSVGHLLTGAGAAAALQTLLGIASRTLPPQANFRDPHPQLKYAAGPFRVLTEAAAWEPRAAGKPRRAAVSGFGFGGVNAHLLFEEYVGQSYGRTTVAAPVPASASRLFPAPTRPKPPDATPVAVVGIGAAVGPWKTAREFAEYALGGGKPFPPAPRKAGWLKARAECPPGFFVEDVRVPVDRFRVPPKELEACLPQQAMLLNVAAEAWDDCTVPPGPGPHPATGVYVGLGLDLNTTNYHLRWAALAEGKDPDRKGPPLTADRVMGNLGSIAASRVARAFGCGGPSFTVCSEETSSGRALDLAVKALRAGEIDRAVVGGVELSGDPRALLATAADRAYAPAGQALPLAQFPGGAVPADGAAAVILKRLADAERDGDRVYAVIRGVGVATGGAADGVTPDAAAYASSLLRACGEAATDPAGIDLYELAAAGTAVEDAVEAEALAAVLASTPRPYPLTLTAAKSQVGHAGFASVLLGFVKTCFALYHEILPPGPQVGELRRPLAGGYAVQSRPRYWLANAGAPRRAAVAGVGVDGTSVHIVLEEAARNPAPGERDQPLGTRHEAVFAVEGDSAADLLAGLARVPTDPRPVEALAREWFAANPRQPGKKLAVALVARSAAELAEQVALATQHLTAAPGKPVQDPAAPELRPSLRDRVHYAPEPLGRAGVAFVFPGSGNQFAGMGGDLSALFPGALRAQQAENRRLRDQYAPHLFWTDELPAAATPRDMLFGQVTFGALVADLLTAHGVKPTALLGQSLGESAGLFGLRVWRDRDEMYRRIQESALFAADLGPPFDAARRFYGLKPNEPLDWVTGVVPAPADDVRSHLRPGLRAYLLIVTTPTECVIGGAKADVQKLVAAVGKPYFPLTGVTLAHCEAGQPVEHAYRELHTLPTTPPPGLTVYSGAWGRKYSPTSHNAADSITAGLLNVIDFPAAVGAAYRDGVRVFVEVGPGNSCTRMISAILANKPHTARAASGQRQDAASQVLRTLAHLISERAGVDLSPLYGGPSSAVGHRTAPPPRREVVLPTGPGAATVQAPPAIPAPAQAPPPPPVKHDAEPTPHSFNPPPVPSDRVEAAPDVTPFVLASRHMQTATADAHEAFLRVQAKLTETAIAALDLQMHLLRRAGDAGPRSAPVLTPAGVPRSLTTEQCFTFARGRVGDVLGPKFAEIDAFPTRVRLPDGPLMLVDTVRSIDGEPLSLTRGRVVTDHLVRADRWYLDAGRCPTSVTVEAGQADLFLAGFLGIDLQTRGLAVYRLLDAVVTFHRGLPAVGEQIVYDIHVDEFFRQADSWLFRFRFEGTVNGGPLLSMKNGVAGFFTEAALAAGQGIVHTKLDLQPMAGKTPVGWNPPEGKSSLTADQVRALHDGDYAAAFGPGDYPADPLRLPSGMLRLVDRVPVIDPRGGRFGSGFVRAEYDIRPKEWFIECHFVDDKVMPGTLMYECCLHTLRILLMRMGWVGDSATVCEPVPGVASRLKCRGQVLETTATVAYEVTVKELGYGPDAFAVADALMFADGKPVVEITNLSLRMVGVRAARVLGIGDRVSEAVTADVSHTLNPKPHTRHYGPESIRAFSNGNPSEAFGDPYRVFDRERKIARLPGPPYQFLDRVVEVTGEPFVLKAGAACVAEYDVPPGEWYFDADRTGRMPFSVLLEVALQPCGWLAAYCGSALTSPEDLRFRNLGGKATQHRAVTPDTGTLTTRVTMTQVSQSAGMIIQHYEMAVTAGGEPVYTGTTYFGFFAHDALKNQVGMPQAKVPYLTADQAAFAEAGLLPHAPPFPAPQMRMVDRIDGYLPHGGSKGLGLVQGRIAVDPGFWFFKAHFFEDPVWPGSLGLESFLQLLKFVYWKKFDAAPAGGWQSVALHAPHVWTYRGQVVPEDREVVVVLEITAEDRAARRLTASGFLTVDGRVIYQMTDFTLE